ncbi:hypothetical protein D0869_04773 [Hortaea werneckii]|uniref:protein-tyrosine-phosphatase n=1 Tax=Hortaea werneckii TaxID=91943 RepID=A0A3M6Z7L3_HORWE|nr:hypothetical protein D0869_04773 [Hortaea werneckii]RMY11204.1 hypothetical protein D0867_08150 [Hortaea werneckii]
MHAMGKSRSATVVCAYLMRRYGITADQALSQIREARSLCEPNEGFWKQLELYHAMATPANVEETPAYQRWLYQREVELSRACGQAPEAEKIRFEDEHAQYLIEHAGKQNGPTACAHYFLDPLSWMRPELEQGKLDGRLECPKCNTNVGKYAWQGMQCSCSEWIVPGISLAKGRVDEMKSKSLGGGMGIRMPPATNGARRTTPAEQGNL